MTIALQAMSSQVSEVTVVLDALVEAQKREDLLLWMRSFTTSKHTNIHLIMTARREQDIESALREWTRPYEIISIQHTDVNDDIHAYVRTRIQQDVGLERWRSRGDVQKEIETSLMKKAGGM